MKVPVGRRSIQAAVWPSALSLVLVGVLSACSSDSSNTDTVSSDGGSGDNVSQPMANGDQDGAGSVPSDSVDNTGLVYDATLFDEQSTRVENTFYPLVPGTSTVFEGQDEEGAAIRVEIAVSHETREIDGVESVIVIDREFEDGELVEETFDWFAEDIEGNVWYLGEASTEYEDGEAVSTDGSWETGADVELNGTIGEAGIIMLANPMPGDRYQHEIYAGVAEDQAEVIALDAPLTLGDGSSFSALQILETDPLEPESPAEYKYYVSGVGFVREEKLDNSETLERVSFSDQTIPDIRAENFTRSANIDNPWQPFVVGRTWTYEVETDEGLERILVEVLDETRSVMGIETRVVRDRVFLDDLLVEDTHDWFAQDNEGNVWYFGEEVVNFDYDEAGNVISTDSDGAWEAGVDGAQPGIQIPVEFRAGDSYRQEYRPGEAEDIAAIVNLSVDVTLRDGSQYSTLQTREWNPLEPESGDEFKYYALGVGLVREEDEDGEEQVDLIRQTP